MGYDFKQDQVVYYLDDNFIIKKAIYKGTVGSLPYKDITHIDSFDEGNILINSDMVFPSRKEAEFQLDLF